MRIENWAKSSGMPPIYVDVLWRKDITCRDLHEEIVIAKGKLPHLGIPHKGLSGDETLIFRRKTEDQNWKTIKPLQIEIYTKEISFRINH